MQIGLREVSLASISAAKTVYQIGSLYHKPAWYGIATGFGDMALFTIGDPKAHGARRRLLAHNYSENWIKQMEPYIAEKTRVAVEKMAEDLNATGHTDVKKWFTFMVGRTPESSHVYADVEPRQPILFPKPRSERALIL